jgi:hypothetical protein
VDDNTTLYALLLRKILAGENVDHDKDGYYLAASGFVAWDYLYASIAQALYRRGLVDDPVVHDADDLMLKRMGEALNCRTDWVPVSLGGR